MIDDIKEICQKKRDNRKEDDSNTYSSNMKNDMV